MTLLTKERRLTQFSPTVVETTIKARTAQCPDNSGLGTYHDLLSLFMRRPTYMTEKGIVFYASSTGYVIANEETLNNARKYLKSYKGVDIFPQK